MPRRVSRPGPPAKYFAVWGSGETSAENITALLDDHIDGLGGTAKISPRFIIPLDKDATTPTVQAVAQYAVDHEFEITVVRMEGPRVKALKEIQTAAKNTVEAADFEFPDDAAFESTEDAIADALVVEAAKHKESVLLFLYPPEDASDDDVEYDERVLYAAFDSGLECLDLTSGLDSIDVGDDSGGGGGDDDTKDGGDVEPEGDGDDDPPFNVVSQWPIRRMRSHAKDIAAKERDEGVADAPTDDEVDEWKKDDIIAYLFPEPEPEPEPEKPTRGRGRAAKATEAAPEGESVTPRRARQIREEIEADGGEPNAGAKKRAAKTAAAAKDAPEEGGEGDDGDGTALDRLARAFLALGSDDLTDDAEVLEYMKDFADAFADHIIDRIAERVEREPEGSPIRKEVAPPRPPGKPRNDGATPQRRRSAGSRRSR